jgi:hypothetical protein
MIAIRMRLARLDTKDGVSLIEPFLPAGSQFEAWKADGVTPVEADSKKLWMLYALSGNPKLALGSRVSVEPLFKNSARLDDVYFNVLLHDHGHPDNQSHRGQRSTYSVVYSKHDGKISAGVLVGVSEGSEIGSAPRDLSSYFFDLAAQWSMRFAPLQLCVECSDIAGEIPTHNTAPVTMRAWVPGYCWILLLPPEVVAVLGGVERVLREAPVDDARQVVYGNGDVAVLCRVGIKPIEVPERRWREWKEYLQPVLGEVAYPRKKYPWILPEDSA